MLQRRLLRHTEMPQKTDFTPVTGQPAGSALTRFWEMH